MKRTLKDTGALIKILTTSPPEKTKTYKPASHVEIIAALRQGVIDSEYKILNESYNSNAEGTIISGKIILDYSLKKDYALSLNFTNSYSKMHSFHFSLGVVYIDKSSSEIKYINFLNDHEDCYNHVQTSKRELDLLKKDVIKDIILDERTKNFFDIVVNDLLMFSTQLISANDIATVIGNLFLNENLNTMQLNQFKENILTKLAPYNAFGLFSQIMILAEDYHPKEQINDTKNLYNSTRYYIINRSSVSHEGHSAVVYEKEEVLPETIAAPEPEMSF